MNEDIIRMAIEAGWDAHHAEFDSRIQAFAALVASTNRERIKQANAPEIERINSHIKELEDAVEAEREACAKLCAGWSDYTNGIAPTLAKAIRARGQV